MTCHSRHLTSLRHPVSTVTHSNATSLNYSNSFMCNMTHFSCHLCMWLLHCPSRGVGMWHDRFMSTVTRASATWLIYIAAHTCVILALPFAWRSYVAWLIHVHRDSFQCDLTHLYCHKCAWMVCISPFPRLSCDMSHSDPPTRLICIHWHDSFINCNMTYAFCHSHVWMVLESPFSFMCNMKLSHVTHEWGQYKNHTRVRGKIDVSCRIRMSHGLEWVTVMLHMNEGNTRIKLVSGDRNESCYTWMSHVALASPFTWRSYVTWLIHTDLDSFTCDMTRTFCHAHVWFLRRHSRGVCTWHDSFTSTMTHSCATCMCEWLLHHYVRGDHMRHDTSMSTVTHSGVTWLIYIATHTCVILALPFAWRLYVIWHIHVDRDSF